MKRVVERAFNLTYAKNSIQFRMDTLSVQLMHMMVVPAYPTANHC